MSASLISNILAACVLAAGYMLPEPYRQYCIDTGSFALAGGVTNWLAVYMLFEKVPLLYGSGVIPQRFEEFRGGIRHLILTEFFTQEHIVRFLAQAKAGGGNLSDMADSLDFDKIFKGLVETIMQSSFGGLLAMAGGAAALEPLKEPIKARLKSMLDEGMATTGPGDAGQVIAAKLQDNIAAIVDARLAELTPQMVKTIVEDMIRKHLGWLVVWGAVFGGLIGLIVSIVD